MCVVTCLEMKHAPIFPLALACRYMMNLKQKQAENYAQKLKRFFTTLDSSGLIDARDGTYTTWFSKYCKNEWSWWFISNCLFRGPDGRWPMICAHLMWQMLRLYGCHRAAMQTSMEIFWHTCAWSRWRPCELGRVLGATSRAALSWGAGSRSFMSWWVLCFPSHLWWLTGSQCLHHECLYLWTSRLFENSSYAALPCLAWHSASEDPQLQIWMSTLDLETHDLVQLFGALENSSVTILQPKCGA